MTPRMGAPTLFLGMATLDFVTVVTHLPVSDEVFEVRSLSMHGGGPAATAAVACARLGGRASFAGALGQDSVAETVAAELVREGVDTRLLGRARNAATPSAVILVEEGLGHRAILYSKGTAPEPEWTAELEASVRGAAMLHIDGFHPLTAIRAARAARAAGVSVSFDGGAGIRWPHLDELLPLVDLLVVARSFAEREAGEGDPAAAARALARAYGAREVVVTDGARGAWYFVAGEGVRGGGAASGGAASGGAASDGAAGAGAVGAGGAGRGAGGEPGEGHVPAYAVDVVDTTGAGDVFHGAYALARSEGAGVPDAVRFASAAAALKCRAPGGRAGIPGRAEVEALIAGRAPGEGNGRT